MRAYILSNRSKHQLRDLTNQHTNKFQKVLLNQCNLLSVDLVLTLSHLNIYLKLSSINKSLYFVFFNNAGSLLNVSFILIIILEMRRVMVVLLISHLYLSRNMAKLYVALLLMRFSQLSQTRMLRQNVICQCILELTMGYKLLDLSPHVDTFKFLQLFPYGEPGSWLNFQI